MHSFKNDTARTVYRRIGKGLAAMERHGIPSSMTLREVRVLNNMTVAFLSHDTVSQSQLVEETGLNKVAVSRYVSAWVDLGWIEETSCCQSDGDRRRRYYKLTEFALANSARFCDDFNKIREVEFEEDQKLLAKKCVRSTQA